MNEQNRLQRLNRPTRRAILAWADACGIDVDNESADTLVRRLHEETIPFDGCVRVKPEQGCTEVVALDDLPSAARAALRSPVRKRVEVHPRCSTKGCGQAFRGFLTTDGVVELSDGEYVCDFASLFRGHCPDHKRAE